MADKSNADWLKSDVERLIEAYNRVHEVLEPEPVTPWLKKWRLARRPERKAAQILCDELGWFVHERESYWRGLQEASERLAVHREAEAEMFANLERLIEQEVTVFSRLGFSEEASSGVISQTYDALSIVRDFEDPSVESLRNLRDRLRLAQEKVCAAARGPLSRAYDKVIGNKGARILAGGAVGSANVAIALIADGGVLSWVSLKAGYHVMRGNTDELIDLLVDGLG
jgi:hypothetical protein